MAPVVSNAEMALPPGFADGITAFVTDMLKRCPSSEIRKEDDRLVAA